MFQPEMSIGLEPEAEMLYDLSRFGNNGTNTDVTWSQLVGGPWVMSFNATSSLVTVPDAASVQNIFNGGGTLFAWINAGSDGESDLGMMASKSDVAGKGFFWGVRSEAAGKVCLWLWYYFSGDDGNWITTSTEITLGYWTLVALTYNSDAAGNNPIFYVDNSVFTVGDGITETTSPTGVRGSDVGEDLIIGNIANASRTFDGKIAFTKILRYIASEGQIAEYYEKTKHLFGIYD